MKCLRALGESMGEFCGNEHPTHGIAGHEALRCLRAALRRSRLSLTPDVKVRLPDQTLKGMPQQPAGQDGDDHVEQISKQPQHVLLDRAETQGNSVIRHRVGTPAAAARAVSSFCLKVSS